MIAPLTSIFSLIKRENYMRIFDFSFYIWWFRSLHWKCLVVEEYKNSSRQWKLATHCSKLDLTNFYVKCLGIKRQAVVPLTHILTEVKDENSSLAYFLHCFRGKDSFRHCRLRDRLPDLLKTGFDRGSKNGFSPEKLRKNPESWQFVPAISRINTLYSCLIRFLSCQKITSENDKWFIWTS